MPGSKFPAVMNLHKYSNRVFLNEIRIVLLVVLRLLILIVRLPSVALLRSRILCLCTS